MGLILARRASTGTVVGGDSSSPGDHGDLSGIERKGGGHPQELAKGWRSLEEL